MYVPFACDVRSVVGLTRRSSKGLHISWSTCCSWYARRQSAVGVICARARQRRLTWFIFVRQGTEKYPDEDEYSQFLAQHGGTRLLLRENAATAVLVLMWRG